jgi:hypothetical protein
LFFAQAAKFLTSEIDNVDDMTRIFVQWPAAIPRQGTVVTAFGESVPFSDYMLTNELVLLIRSQPDAHGTRRIIMKLADIVAVRIVEAIEPERFTVMGFQKHALSVSRPPA